MKLGRYATERLVADLVSAGSSLATARSQAYSVEPDLALMRKRLTRASLDIEHALRRLLPKDLETADVTLDSIIAECRDTLADLGASDGVGS